MFETIIGISVIALLGAITLVALPSIYQRRKMAKVLELVPKDDSSTDTRQAA